MATVHHISSELMWDGVGIIICARMTSSRFPGKPVALINDKPVIAHVVDRCLEVGCKVIVAVPMNSESVSIIDVLKEYEGRIEIFPGSELDVLARMYYAAKQNGLNYIIRITGDCPLCNPVLVKEVFYALIRNKVDYASNIYPNRTFAKGLDVEAFTFDCLEAAHLLATKRYDREHVTVWMQENDEINKCNITQRNADHLNLCVDYPEDIARLEKLIAERAQDVEAE